MALSRVQDVKDERSLGRIGTSDDGSKTWGLTKLLETDERNLVKESRLPTCTAFCADGFGLCSWQNYCSQQLKES